MAGLLLGLLAIPFAGPFDTPARADGDDESKFGDFKAVTKGAKEHEGLLRLWKKGEALYAELTPKDLNKSFLAPMAIAQGLGQGGLTLNFDEQWVLHVQARRRQGPPHPPQRALHRPRGLADRQGRRDDLHRLGAAGPAHRSDQPATAERR